MVHWTHMAASATHPDAPTPHLADALSSLILRPRTTILLAWSWKAAAISAILRATTFFATNLRSGGHEALRAALVEAVFAIFAAGLMGAISQRLRAARPVWATLLIVSFLMPGLMFFAQRALHQAAATPHMAVGLIVSFCFASIASTFSWYAMRSGALLGGHATTALSDDLRQLPRIILNFILIIPRALLSVFRH